VKFITGARARRLLPASVVVAVIGLAYLSPLPADASKVNNCGVKGGYAYGGYAFAFHDHGKACPNRPFPGKGKGVLKFVVPGTTPATVATSTTTSPTNHGKSKSTSSTSNSAVVTATTNTQSSSKSHGHGKGHGRGAANRLNEEAEAP
jgi:hypothetical protein